MAIDVSDIVAEYGDYYINNGQNATDLMQKLHQPSVTAEEFRTIPTTDTVVRKGSSAMTRVLQPFQKAFTPIGDLSFLPHLIELFNMKIDVEFMPDEIVDTWVGFLEGLATNERDKWPFVRWFIEVHIIAQSVEDYELYEAWDGVYAPPTPGTAGALGTATDGIKTIFTKNAGRINTIAMGAMPTDPVDVVSYVEDFVKEIPQLYRDKMRNLYVNPDVMLAYKMGKEEKYNKNYANDKDLVSLKFFPNIMVKGLPSMKQDNTIWCTLEENKIRPIRRAQFSNLKVGEYSPRKVSVFGDWWSVCSFVHPESIFRNDQ